MTGAAPLPRMVAELADSRTDHPAIVGVSRTLTYGQLHGNANRAAHALRGLGVGEGDRVAYLDLNNPEFFELLVGAARLGAAVTPVNYRLTPAEIGRILRDSGATVLVVGPTFEPMVPELRSQAPGLAHVIGIGGDYLAWLSTGSADDPGRPSTGADVVLQLYTSGTTGEPKGVMLTNDNCAKVRDVAAAWAVDETSVSMVAMPLFHIGGSGWANVALARGGTDVLVPVVDPVGLLDTIEQAGVTNAFLVPAVLQMMCAVPGAEGRDYSRLRSISYGASPITTAALKRCLDVFGVPLFQVYGLTETTGAITELGAGDHDPGGPREHLLRSAGRPYPWVELKAVDPLTGADCAPGVVGEIRTRSAQNSPGYWHRPAETDAAFDAEGWLHTGDAGYLDDDGFVFLTDRIKDLIVTGAENVYPVEVESALAEHPDVADVAVIGVPDERWGETVKAVVVRRPGASLTEEALLSWARGRVAGFKRPRSVDFVDVLPRNPTGKLLKRVLREPYWAGVEGRRIG